ncbi:MAG: hypothetical protein IKE22_01775, partial [Atopobiaceae bacterium]|nr:hypothetical protein [Atopobiaceae bacterium]
MGYIFLACRRKSRLVSAKVVTYSEGVDHPRHKLGEPTSVLREPKSRVQYRYPSMMRKLERAMRAPTF